PGCPCLWGRGCYDNRAGRNLWCAEAGVGRSTKAVSAASHDRYICQCLSETGVWSFHYGNGTACQAHRYGRHMTDESRKSLYAPGMENPTTSQRRLITVVIPARNEAANMARLEQELLACIQNLPHDFEFIIIDNCSVDATGELAKALCQRDPRWKYIRFSRNFTVEMSITAGYHFASGDAIIVLYSDLQDPPDLIPQFIAKWEEGYDVVYGVRTVRPGDPAWRNFAVKIAYWLIAAMADVAIPINA